MPDETPRAATIEFRRLQSLLPQGDVLGRLDAPAPPVMTTLPFVSVSGWTVSLQAPLRQVSVRRDGRTLAQAQPLRRPDVANVVSGAEWAESSGFRATLWAHELAGEFAADVEGEYEDGSVVKLWRLEGWSAPSVAETPFAPETSAGDPAAGRDGASQRGALVVTSFGRSGSSMIMQMLGEHPEVLVRRVPPFEARFVQASCARAFLLLAMSDPQATGVDTLGVNRLWDNAVIASKMAGGDAELRARTAFAALERVCAEFHRGVGDYLDVLGRLEGKPETRYVCEKSWIGGPQAQLEWLWPGSREIVLVRDLRDVICSIDSFNRKRGFASFGREAYPDDEAYFGHIAQMADTIIARAERPPGVSRVVRYEDLITDPERVMAELCAWLEIDARADVVAATANGVSKYASFRNQHVTSRSTDQSIGRWRTEFSEHKLALYERLLAERNRRLGYDLEPAGRLAASA